MYMSAMDKITLSNIPIPREEDKKYVIHSIIIAILTYYIIWRITKSFIVLMMIPLTYFIFLYIVSSNIWLKNMTKPVLKYIAMPYFVFISAIDKFRCPVGCAAMKEGKCDCI